MRSRSTWRTRSVDAVDHHDMWYSEVREFL